MPRLTAAGVHLGLPVALWPSVRLQPWPPHRPTRVKTTPTSENLPKASLAFALHYFTKPSQIP